MTIDETLSRVEKPASDSATSQPRRSRPALWSIAVAAIALMAVGGIGGWLLAGQDDEPVADERQAITLTADQQEAIAVVAAHQDAHNAADSGAMRATLTTNATWTSVDIGKTADPISAEDYINVVRNGPDVWTWTGEPTAVGDLPNPSGNIQVAVPTHREISGGPDADGLMLYTLREIDGQLKIEEIFWMSLDQ